MEKIKISKLESALTVEENDVFPFTSLARNKTLKIRFSRLVTAIKNALGIPVYTSLEITSYEGQSLIEDPALVGKTIKEIFFDGIKNAELWQTTDEGGILVGEPLNENVKIEIVYYV
jgi:hypothetical protein